MGTIRHQGIQSTIITYLGVLIGAFNMLLFTKFLPPEVLGLTRLLNSIVAIFLTFSSLGSITMMNKFYPYYRDILSPKQRDLFGIVIILCVIGFTAMCIGAFIFKSNIIASYQAQSPLFTVYFNAIFPYAFFFLIYGIIESYSFNQFKTVVPIFIREVLVRLLTTIIIVAFMLKFLHEAGFIITYTLIYGIAAAVLISYLIKLNLFQFSFKISSLTKKLRKKIIGLTSIIYGGSLFSALAQNIDTLVISKVNGLATTAVFDLSTYISNVIMIPQKSVIAISVPVLSKAWKDKDFGRIQRIYERSSLILLTYALLIFFVIWLNFDSAFTILGLPDKYREGKWVVFILGMMRIMDLGTGVNSQIIGTSNHWKFEFTTNLILVCLSIPLNYIMIVHYSMIGSAIAQIFSLFVFNLIRFTYLYRKYDMQPFSKKTFYTVLLAVGGYIGAAFLLNFDNPYINVIAKSIFFVGIFIGGNIIFNISEDIQQTYQKGLQTVKKIVYRAKQ
ncbi:O-antigen/teichoic acid export membrane protein [Chitinophaga skermanii]|uniref:O-antigen/teichoic acid export membrane protein n=1 Tax=Chitinophaga skermanii TaxID=331697 RepID=A0A327QX67_9BACT|nr:polysaccharide biosynthesis C-terminal domain-containing protein [Chitinophaga skermanii]RAJ08398.1 O-antigen/teichoic acid export membrane protein [Chitinophaga skermanii]